MSTNFGKCFKTVALILIMIASPMMLFAEEGTLDWIRNLEVENSLIMQTSSCMDNHENLIVTYHHLRQDEDPIQNWEILKIDSEGNLLWETNLSSMINYGSRVKVVVDIEGNLYVAGEIFNDDVDSAIRVLKINPDGNIIWETTLTDDWVELQNLFCRDDGYLSIVHQGYGEWSITTLYTSDAQMGEVAWTSSVNGIDDQDASILEFSGIDVNNRITLLGILQTGENTGIGWVQFDANGSNGATGSIDGDSDAHYLGDTKMDNVGNVYTLYGQDESDSFKLIAINGDGNHSWTSQISGNVSDIYSTSLVINQDGPVVAYTTEEGSLIAEKYSAQNGAEVWTTQVNSCIGYLPRSSVVMDDEENLYFIGADFRMIETYTMIGITSDGNVENWILNISNPSVPGNATGIPQYVTYKNDAVYCVVIYSNWETETMGLDQFRIDINSDTSIDNVSEILPNVFTVDTYPNPFNATLNVRMSLSIAGEVKVRLVDMLGRTVYETKENIGNGSHVLSVNAEDLTSGMYLLEASDRNGNRVAKRVTLLK